MLPKAANLQKIRDGRRTYAITPSIPGGFIKPNLLKKYCDIAEKYNATLKITSAQRIMIIGLKAEDVEQVWEELGIVPALSYANCVRSIKMCPGSAFCKRGIADSIKLGMELDRRYHKKEMPSRLKIGVAGCPNSCSEVHIKDIGVLADDAGWSVLVGGSCGRHPRLADKLAEGLSDEEVLQLVEVIMAYYQENSDIERLGAMIDRIGFATFQSDILKTFAATRQQPVESKEPEASTQDSNNEIKEEVNMERKITKDSIIGDIVRQYPASIAIFRSHGMGCLGCPSAVGESVEKAAGIHGLEVEQLLADLNKAV